MTDDELGTLQKRRGYWLRMARQRRGKDYDQNSVAKAIGLSRKSGTTILAWEKGRRSPTMQQLDRLASLYEVPTRLFVDPPMSDEEWLDRLVAGAGELEREDWERGDRGDPGGVGGNGGGPRRPQA